MAKPKILLVDPDPKSRQMLEISLKKGGFTVTAVEEGEKALQLIDTLQPDLIISDTDLAGAMDGYLFCKLLKEQETTRNIPFVFLTKRKAVEDKIRGLQLGVDDYLTKPIYLKELLARVSLILEKKRQERLDATGPLPQFQGDLSQLSVVDLLQTMEMGSKTGIIHLQHGDREAKLFVRQGRVVHAVCDNLVGERAVYRTLLWNEGSFSIEFRRSLQTQETIQLSTQGLIMEGMRRLDELERLKEQLPPFDTYLAIDSQTILEEHPDRFPAKIENILAEFDGESTLEEVVERLPYDDLESLDIISKLYFQGFLMEVERPKPTEPQEGTVATSGEATVTGLAGLGPTLDTQLLSLEEASRSIEEIKAKARLKNRPATPPAASASSASTPRSDPVAPSGPQGETTDFELAPPVEEQRGRAEETSIPEVPMVPPEDPNTREADREAAILFEVEPEEAELTMPPMDAPSGPVGNGSAAGKVVQMPQTKRPQRPADGAQPAAAAAGSGGAIAAAEPAPPPPPAAQEPPSAELADRDASRRLGWLVGFLTLVTVALVGGWWWWQAQGPPAPSVQIIDPLETAERALTMARQERWATALRLADEALAHDPKLVPALYAKARALEHLGRTDQAERLYGQVLEIHPRYYRAKYDLLALRLDRGDAVLPILEEAERLLTAVDPTEEHDLYVDTALLAARAAIAAQRWDQAKRALDAAAAVAPSDQRITVLRGRLPTPVASPRARTTTKPRVAEPNKTAPAEPRLKPTAMAKAPAATPDRAAEAKRWHKKGLAFYRKGYLRNALRAFQKTVALDPDNDEAWVDLGRVLVELGQERKALNAFLTAGRINPRNPRVYINLGAVYTLQGERDQARKAYAAYLELVPPNSPEAQEVRKILENL